MFDLVGKRYLFLLISLIIIVPGTISLLVKGLNVGIDFKGGATVELRPSTNITSAQMTRYLQPLRLENLDVHTGTNTTLKGPDVVWVRLNTQVDANVTDYIISTLQKQYGSQLTVQVSDLSIDNQKISVLDITHFQGAPATPAKIKTWPGYLIPLTSRRLQPHRRSYLLHRSNRPRPRLAKERQQRPRHQRPMLPPSRYTWLMPRQATPLRR